jgi:hypothetical protein
MKPMTLISSNRALLAGLALGAAGLLSAQASSTIITFSVDMSVQITAGTFVPGTDAVSVHGTFDGWTTGANLVQAGTGTVYTNTVNDTTDANGGSVLYKFVNNHPGFASGGYESLCDGGGNRGWILPAVSGSSLVLPTPFFADSGTAVTYTNTITFQVDMSQQINLGYFTNGISTIDVAGNFDGWTAANGPLTWNPSIIRTTPGGLQTSNVYVGTFTSVAVSTNAHMAYQFVMNGTSYEGESAANNDGGGNRFFTMLPVNQTNPVVFYADAPYAPASLITFSVDMSIVVATDTNFNPTSVTINGDLMGWGGVAMTNNPSAANTNIYSSPSYLDGVGASVNYQFRYTELSTGGTVYDHANGANGGNNNRLFVVPNVATTNVLAVFNDASPDDYLLQPTPVTFSVDMSDAVGTDGIAFNPSADNVYINGTFANWYAWSGGANIVSAPAGYQMTEVGLTTIYTNTLVLPAGSTVSTIYKYGMDHGGELGGPADDEAASGQNHERVVRATAFNPYVFPTDKFGFQYNEPFFSSTSPGAGELSVGAKSGGKVPVTWLGRPGAHLQSATNLTAGGWVDLPATDGTNWVSGYSSTNGFVSQTNWPATSKAFFRLIKP